MLEIINYFLAVFALAFYLETALQWYSYRIERVIFHYNKPLWHFWFFILPSIAYFGLKFLPNGKNLLLTFLVIFIICEFFWHKKLDKKLVFTARVKRFFAFLAVFSLVFLAIFEILKAENLPLFLPIIFALLASFYDEKRRFSHFYNKAKEKIAQNQNLIIVQITASFGKTSIKNFLFELLKNDFKTQKTPRSVNTLAGLVRDINENLAFDTRIYIAEAGARQNGDIAEITEFLEPQIVIVGEIGLSHIEYFKSVENIRATKLEALLSKRLKQAFLHSTTLQNESEKFSIYDRKIASFTSDLNGTSVTLKSGESVFAPILGAFNAENLAVCIMVAKFLGLNAEKIAKNGTNIAPVEHRLQKIEANGKIIIDDSFNGNIGGMLASYELVATFKGRKVIITPGIVETTKEQNEILGEKIAKIFDLVMITGSLNAEILSSKIAKEKLIFIKDKSKMTEILAQNTQAGDLILFSNDAPSFI